VDEFYDQAGSLFVDAYDAFYGSSASQLGAIVAFHEHLAHKLGGPVLEIACGTGRIALPLAQAGLNVMGVDRSEAMLAIARRKVAKLPADVQERTTLVNQDMSALNLNRRFSLIFVPARSFQHLLTIELQRKSLQAFGRHLEPTGRIVLHLFDPRLDLLIDEKTVLPGLFGTHPETGRHYVGEVLRTTLDHLNQIRHDVWRYREIGANGDVLAEDTREMSLRWTYRWELHHLLELCGFAVEAEYSDYLESPPAYGRELIVVARPA
jgi:ubiquinone/menaquinone biosynthesis C-methylase UbiE